MTNSLFSHHIQSITRFCSTLKPDRPKYTAPKTLLLFIILATTHLVNGQAPVINCPSAAVILQDSTRNDSLFWAAIYDPQTPDITYDLHERNSIIEISATNPCPNSTLTFRYRLDLDLDNNGTPETRIHSTVVPPPGKVLAWNLNTGTWTEETFDNRDVAPAQKWRFGIRTLSPNSPTQKAQIIWENTANYQPRYPMLPPGHHTVTWYVKNQCAPEDSCTFPLTILAPVYQDTIPPTVSCIGQTTVNQISHPTGTTRWASDFLVSGNDNLSQNQLLMYGVRRSGTGTGFPFLNNLPRENITFFCDDTYSYVDVELWVMDESGNASFCETSVLVLDNTGDCTELPLIFTGYIQTPLQEGIDDVTIDFTEIANIIPGMPTSLTTNTYGAYSILILNAIPNSFEIIPQLNADPLNGINTWDLVLISRHILNLQALDSPYKIIAADANKSGTVTTFDIVELRKLLLGTYPLLPENSSWRFIRKNQIFSNNDNPFINVLQESVLLGDAYTNITGAIDFVGIKIGDVDYTAPPNLLAPDDRDASFTAFNVARNDIKNWLINKGETVELTFSNPSELSGYQMTLETDGIQPSEVVPGEGMSSDHFGLFDHAVTTVFEQGNTPFSIRFTAEESGDLRDMIQVSSRITPAMAFGENGEKMQVNLRFEGEKSSISPNPWSEHTRIHFYTPEATTATLNVFDMAGRLVYSALSHVEKGEQAFELNSAQVPASGILIYEITTENGVFSGKMHKQ